MANTKPTTNQDKMLEYVNKLIADNHVGYIINTSDLLKGFNDTYNALIQPSDYCYNRVTKGTKWDKDYCLLVYLQEGLYKCLGQNHVYDGAILREPVGAESEIVVGYCVNGKRLKIVP